MIFKSDASIDGKLVYGYEEGWHWSRNGGGYNKSRDFFWIHWEVGARMPNAVKLHVECPNASIDPQLNEIKQQLVKEFLSAHFKNIVEQHGYGYKIGNRSKVEHMEKFKCTSPFHVILPPDRAPDTAQECIEQVNDVFGNSIREVVERFRVSINQEFPS